MTEPTTSTCAFCNAIKDLDTELIVVTDEWGNLELSCDQCIDGEEIRNATDWIRQEIIREATKAPKTWARIDGRMSNP